MKCSHLRFFLLPFFTVFFIQVKSQTLLNTTGNTITNTSFSFEYSIGEIGITTLTGGGKDITQGLLQPVLKKVMWSKMVGDFLGYNFYIGLSI